MRNPRRRLAFLPVCVWLLPTDYFRQSALAMSHSPGTSNQGAKLPHITRYN